MVVGTHKQVSFSLRVNRSRLGDQTKRIKDKLFGTPPVGPFDSTFESTVTMGHSYFFSVNAEDPKSCFIAKR